MEVDSEGLDRFKIIVYVARMSFDRFCPSIYSKTIVKQVSISYLLGVCCFYKNSHTNNRCPFAKSARTYILSSSAYVSQIVSNTLRWRKFLDYEIMVFHFRIVLGSPRLIFRTVFDVFGVRVGSFWV